MHGCKVLLVAVGVGKRFLGWVKCGILGGNSCCQLAGLQDTQSPLEADQCSVYAGSGWGCAGGHCVKVWFQINLIATLVSHISHDWPEKYFGG